MWQSAVDAPFTQRVWVVLGALEDLLVADITCPYIGVSEEETLLFGELKFTFLARFTRVNGFTLLVRFAHVVGFTLFLCVLEGQICHLQAAMVSDVLAQSECAISECARCYLNTVKVVFKHLGALVEAGFIFRCPPVDEVAILVELATLVVETVGHLVADHHADSAIVEGIVGVHIEEWILQDTCWEADLVGSRIVVGIHSLWGHIPFIFVHRFAQEAQRVVLLKLSRTLYVGIVAERWVDIEGGIIAPFVRITDFNGEGVEFLHRFSLGLV